MMMMIIDNNYYNRNCEFVFYTLLTHLGMCGACVIPWPPGIIMHTHGVEQEISSAVNEPLRQHEKIFKRDEKRLR